MKIKGYFGDLKSANETVEKLKTVGFENAYVDANDHYVENRNVKTNLPGTIAGQSLTDLVMHSGNDTTDRNNAPLTAASPMVSGMAGFEEVADINYALFVETEDNNSAEAENIIKSMGGTLYDPNV